MIDRITEQPFCQTRVMCRAVDNLELLLSQPDESVNMIYCDILYGTGRNFGDSGLSSKRFMVQTMELFRDFSGKVQQQK